MSLGPLARRSTCQGRQTKDHGMFENKRQASLDLSNHHHCEEMEGTSTTFVKGGSPSNPWNGGATPQKSFRTQKNNKIHVIHVSNF